MPQRQPRGHLGPNLSAARLVRGAALAASVAVLPLATACGADDDGAAADGEQSRRSSPVAAAVAPARVEVIAGLTGCKAKIRIEAEQLREGVCHTEQGDYIITTFPEEKYKQTWLEEAGVYGGKYLVGMRWVVAAQPKMLEPLRAKLGGTIRQLQGFNGTPAGPKAP